MDAASAGDGQRRELHPPVGPGPDGAAAAPSTLGCSTTRARPGVSRPGRRHRRRSPRCCSSPGLAHRHVVADAFLDHGSLASLREPCSPAAGGDRRSSPPGLGRRTDRAPGLRLGQVGAPAGHREHVAALGPAGLERQRPGRLSMLMTTGIDALDGYFARYLPQLFLAVIVPVAVIARRGRGGLGQRRADRRQPAADPDLHGPGRRHHQGPHHGPHALAAEAGRPLPRRGARACPR